MQAYLNPTQGEKFTNTMLNGTSIQYFSQDVVLHEFSAVLKIHVGAVAATVRSRSIKASQVKFRSLFACMTYIEHQRPCADPRWCCPWNPTQCSPLHCAQNSLSWSACMCDCAPNSRHACVTLRTRPSRGSPVLPGPIVCEGVLGALQKPAVRVTVGSSTSVATRHSKWEDLEEASPDDSFLWIRKKQFSTSSPLPVTVQVLPLCLSTASSPPSPYCPPVQLSADGCCCVRVSNMHACMHACDAMPPDAWQLDLGAQYLPECFKVFYGRFCTSLQRFARIHDA